MSNARELYPIGEAPPLGVVPQKMHAWLVRPERFGEPLKAWRQEVVDIPPIADDEVLVYVMAAGINYNNVWAGLGVPVNVIGARNRAGEPEEFHIGGSDASGIVYKVGRDVKDLKVGDEVVVHCGTWSRDCPQVRSGVDPMYSPTFRIWGYETNWGSFAQFTKVQAQQCLPRPRHLTWEQSAAYMLVGATAYRMLMGWPPNTVQEGDPVLIWGGAGGLGSIAIQIARARGALPVAVVSSEDKFEYCRGLGAKGCINRQDFDHWGMLPHWKDQVGYANWLKGVRAFGKRFWDVLGEKRSPTLVFEHPGETTIPTSIFVTETGGMVTICAGTTGYNATVDLRYLWMRQKRLQGSHFANRDQADAFNRMVIEGQVDPCLSRTFTYEELPLSHQLMYENRHPHGNMSVLVGAREPGTGAGARTPVAAKAMPPAVPGSRKDLTMWTPPTDLDLGSLVDDPTTVGELMHEGLVACRPTCSIVDAADLMVRDGIHAVFVLDDADRLVGVLSQTDLVLARQGRSREQLQAIRVAEIMTPDPVHCT
ncbi:MAG: crotonyl-CoA carboxylase/reductase, partial [Deltaproteobacteria bacterium]|nr:crotonyl-CoA carboxylase/reductase [Deltaproteobacteria bacterium]